MKLVPLGDRVVLKQLVAEETTKSGIVLPGQNKEKPQQAEVIAVGPGGVVDGKEVKMEVKPGDQVIYSKYAGTEVKLEEEEYIVTILRVTLTVTPLESIVAGRMDSEQTEIFGAYTETKGGLQVFASPVDYYWYYYISSYYG